MGLWCQVSSKCYNARAGNQEQAGGGAVTPLSRVPVKLLVQPDVPSIFVFVCMARSVSSEELSS